MGLVDALFLLGLVAVMLVLMAKTPQPTLRRSRSRGFWFDSNPGDGYGSAADCGGGFDGGGGGGGGDGGC